MSVKRHAQLAAALSMLLLAGAVLAALALADIGQNIEPDLSNEWTVVRLFFALSILTPATVLSLVWRLRRQLT